MYQIKSNTHRITRFVIGEAYKWLYREIDKGNYTTNKHTEARNLMARIKAAKKLDAETYSAFLEMMNNSPFNHLIGQKNKTPTITTNNIMNYFVEFNGVALPLGFIMEFFEDEYEMPKDRQKVIDAFIDSERNQSFGDTCRAEIMKHLDPQTKFRKKYPCVFSTPAGFYASHIARVIFTIVLAVFFFTFMAQSRMGAILGDYLLDAKFDAKAEISAEYGVIESYLQEIDTADPLNPIQYKDYFAKFGGHIALNALLFIILLFRLSHLIKFIIVVIKLLSARFALNKQDADIAYLDDQGIEDMKAYFSEIAPSLKKSRKFTEDMFEGVPKASKRYVSVVNFEFNKIERSIRNMYSSSSAKKINAIYTNETELSICRKKWRSGFIRLSLLTIFFLIVNISGLYELIIPQVAEIIVNIFG
ncbi:MAG: hypothetical protein IKC26_03305 [Clostridia bacterium]|nr:hypothetical protein [Clostridia bacterium]